MPASRLSESDLRALERAPHPQVSRLVGEIRRLRSLLDRIYPYMQETRGAEDALAELEREVLAIREERRRGT